MAALRPLANLLAASLAVAYPFAVYFGLGVVEPRVLGGLLVAVLLLRHGGAARRFAHRMAAPEWLMAAALGGLAIGIVAFNSAELLLYYPAVVSFGLLVVFGRTLLVPPSLVERIARLTEPDLPPEGVRYTARVTLAWCLFFLANGMAAVATVFAGRDWWLFYNGFLSYCLMGALFAGEWLLRRRLRLA